MIEIFERGQGVWGMYWERGMQGLNAGLDSKYVVGKSDGREGADGGIV